MAKELNATADRDADEHDDERSSESSKSKRGSSPTRKKDRQMTAGMHWLFQLGLYKRSQGRITRQVTGGALLAGLAFGCWRLSHTAMDAGALFEFGVPLLVFAVGAWIVYRLVNFPKFADFLIAVEAEMAKVSWPTRGELVRSSIVVILTIVGLAIILFAFDSFWIALFRLLRVTG